MSAENIRIASEPEGPNHVHALHARIGGDDIRGHLRSVRLEVETPSSVPVLVIETEDAGRKIRVEYLVEAFDLDAVTKVVRQ